MAAIVEVKEANGITPDWTVVSSIRFCTSDKYNPGLNFPLSIPSTGYRYSYWKTLCLELSGAFSQISNIKFYCDGAVGYTFGTDGALNIGTKDTGDSGLPIASYDQATGEEGVSGDAMNDAGNGHAVYKGAGYTVKNVTTYGSGSPLDLDSTEYTAAGKTKAVVLQVKCSTVANGAEAGLQNAETLTFRYDEI